MPESVLSDTDFAIIRRSLIEAAEGPYFPDWEFQTIFGFSREELRDFVGGSSSSIDLSQERQKTIVLQVLVNLAGYPHGSETKILQKVGASRRDLIRLIGVIGKK